MKAKYVSVWDGGIELVSNCQYDKRKNIVYDIQDTHDINLEVLEDEYVLLPDGAEVRNFITEDDEEYFFEDGTFRIPPANSCEHSDDVQEF